MPVSGHAGGVGQGGEHQAVPARQHLVVGSRLNPTGAGRVQLPAGRLDTFGLLRRDPGGQIRHAAPPELGVVRVGKVAALADAKNGHHLVCVVSQHISEFLRRPHEGQALDVVGVGVLGAVETAFRRQHLAFQVLKRAQRPVQQLGVPTDGVAAQEYPHQLGIVVQHLLEVRHAPASIHAVTVKAAAELVTDAAAQHGLQAVQGHRLALGLGQQKLQRGGRRKLGRTSEAAVDRVVKLRQVFQRARQQVVGPAVWLCGRGARLPDVRRQRFGVAFQLGPLARPGVRHRLHDAPETGHALHVARRKVGSGVEGPQVRRQKHRHGPAARAGHGLHRAHVQPIDVGALLAVQLDVDKLGVHIGRRRLVLEALVRHDVAPVAGRVAHRQQNGAVPLTGRRKRLLAPGVPLHRVVHVLTQVGAGFLGQSVGEGGCGLGHAPRLQESPPASDPLGVRTLGD